MRHLMAALYVALLIVCVIGFVRHRRWHDPRLLAALAVPMMLAYAFLPQMIERYLIWPAAFLSAYAAMSIAGLTLWLSVSAIAVVLMSGYMLTLARQTQEARDWLPYLQPIFPDIAWAVLALAIVMLYLGCTSSGRAAPWAKAAEAK
jgi:hypothetical protein